MNGGPGDDSESDSSPEPPGRSPEDVEPDESAPAPPDPPRADESTGAPAPKESFEDTTRGKILLATVPAVVAAILSAALTYVLVTRTTSADTDAQIDAAREADLRADRSEAYLLFTTSISDAELAVSEFIVRIQTGLTEAEAIVVVEEVTSVIARGEAAVGRVEQVGPADVAICARKYDTQVLRETVDVLMSVVLEGQPRRPTSEHTEEIRSLWQDATAATLQDGDLDGIGAACTDFEPTPLNPQAQALFGDLLELGDE